MDPPKQLFKSLFVGWLAILIPVDVGETPEEGMIAKILCHFQVGFAVFALWWTIKSGNFLSGDLPIQFSTVWISSEKDSIVEICDMSL